jgi:hypothetical protein
LETTKVDFHVHTGYVYRLIVCVGVDHGIAAQTGTMPALQLDAVSGDPQGI